MSLPTEEPIVVFLLVVDVEVLGLREDMLGVVDLICDQSVEFWFFYLETWRIVCLMDLFEVSLRREE